MKKILLVFIILLSGCDAPPAAKQIVRDKHAQMYVWVQRINSSDATKHPTPEQNAEMLRAVLKDMESLDKLINNWKKSPVMDETNLKGNDTTEILDRYKAIEIAKTNGRESDTK